MPSSNDLRTPASVTSASASPPRTGSVALAESPLSTFVSRYSVSALDALLTILGIGLIALALRDIFETLFHPSGRGAIGYQVVRAVAAIGKRFEGVWGSAAVLIGPLGYVAVLATWTTMLVVGWALIFLPHLPEGFLYGQGLNPAEHDSLIDAIYLSLVNLTSLGYGDIAPEAWGLRILGPVETLFGLGLLTASISWLISIYRTIARRDALAHEILLVERAEERLGEPLAEADPDLLETILTSFADGLIVARRDLIHFPISSFFVSEDDRLALSELFPFLRRLIEEACEDGRAHALRVRAEILRDALEDYEATIGGRAGA